MSEGMDLQSYDTLLDSLYAGLNTADGFNPFLEKLCEWFHCYTATLGIRDNRTGHLVGGWFQNMPEQDARWYMTNLAHKDPLLNEATRMTPIGFCSAQSHPAITMEDDDIRSWCEQSGIIDGASALVHKDAQTTTFLTLSRQHTQIPFSHDELSIFNLFIPHVRRAIGLQKALSQHAQSYQPLVQALNHLSQGLLIVNNHFQVAFLNHAAEAYLAGQSWLTYQNRTLVFESAELNAQYTLKVTGLLHSTLLSGASDAQFLAIPPSKNQEGLTLIFVPLKQQWFNTEATESCSVMILLQPWKTSIDIKAKYIQQHFQLSKAEATVCAYLCQGQSINDIAEKLNREASTIRSHIKSLYRKTATNRQAELVSHVLTNLLQQPFSLK